MMKRIAIYTILLVVLVSTACTRTDEYDTLGHQGNALVVNAELVSASDWATRGGLSSTSQGAECGAATLSTDGEFLITATREEWTGTADSLQRDGLTRGTPIAAASGIANLSINVFNTGTSDWSASSPLTAAVTATQSGNGYTTSPTYAWLISSTIKTSLFAYSPTPTADNGVTASSPTKIDYTVPTAVANQPDLCVATPKMNVINADGTQQAQTFALRHQLTAVGFSMLGWNLKIDKITVSGINTTGILTMNANGAHTWASSNPGSRDLGVTQSSYTHSHTSSYADITKSDGYLMMIPQELSDAATVTITYTSTGTGSTSGTLIAKLNELGTTWDAGDKVTYNIRLKTAPAVTSGNLTITDYKAGYTTSSPLSIIIDPKDKLTFSWSASWLKIHRGSPKMGDTSGGATSPWTANPGGPWGNIYFYATNDNPSTTTDRTATVTVTGTRSGTKTFTVKQAKAPIIPTDYTATPANCYATYPKDGAMQKLKFNALKKPVAKYQKGNSTAVNATGANPSTAAADASLSNDITYQTGDKIEVSWQTAVNHGTSGGAANMVIKSITLGADGVATVEVNGAGNAVLSYKRSNGTILWNYHIWATDSNPFTTHYATGGNVNGSTPNGQAQFMDRSLGALSAATAKPAAANAYKYFGMIYQHGRPTPFSGQGTGQTVDTYTAIYNGAATKLSSGSIGGYTPSNTAVSSVTSAIQTPNTYYYFRDAATSNQWTWYKFADISLWSDYGTNKSIYDPCPYGYRVPINGSWTGFPGTKWTANIIEGGTVWSNTWWPASGYRAHNSGALVNVGVAGYGWSSTRYSSAYSSYYLTFDYNGLVLPSAAYARGYAFSIRCVQEGY